MGLHAQAAGVRREEMVVKYICSVTISPSFILAQISNEFYNLSLSTVDFTANTSDINAVMRVPRRVLYELPCSYLTIKGQFAASLVTINQALISTNTAV